MVGRIIKKIKSDLSGSALVFTLLISSLLMIAALAVITVTKDDFEITVFRTESSQAKYVADSAVEIIKQQIKDTEAAGERLSVPRENNLRAAGGEYDYSVEPPPEESPEDPYIINVWARVRLANGEVVQKNIEVEYEYNSSGEPGGGGGTDPPPASGMNAFDFTVYQGGSSGTLQLDGGSFICKGDIHSNSKIMLKDNNGNPGLIIEGTVSTSADSIDKDIKNVGNVDLSKAVLKANQPEIPVPVVDWDFIGTKVTPITPGKGTLELTEGVQESIYVIGDLILTGNALLNSNALIVATGDITITGNYRYPNSDYLAVGIIAGNNLYFEEADKHNPDDPGLQIRGFAMGLNDVTVNADTKINGTLVAGRKLEISKGLLELNTDQNKPAYEVINTFGKKIFSNL